LTLSFPASGALFVSPAEVAYILQSNAVARTLTSPLRSPRRSVFGAAWLCFISALTLALSRRTCWILAPLLTPNSQPKLVHVCFSYFAWYSISKTILSSTPLFVLCLARSRLGKFLLFCARPRSSLLLTPSVEFSALLSRPAFSAFAICKPYPFPLSCNVPLTAAPRALAHGSPSFLPHPFGSLFFFLLLDLHFQPALTHSLFCSLWIRHITRLPFSSSRSTTYLIWPLRFLLRTWRRTLALSLPRVSTDSFRCHSLLYPSAILALSFLNVAFFPALASR